MPPQITESRGRFYYLMLLEIYAKTAGWFDIRAHKVACRLLMICDKCRQGIGVREMHNSRREK